MGSFGAFGRGSAIAFLQASLFSQIQGGCGLQLTNSGTPTRPGSWSACRRQGERSSEWNSCRLSRRPTPSTSFRLAGESQARMQERIAHPPSPTLASTATQICGEIPY